MTAFGHPRILITLLAALVLTGSVALLLRPGITTIPSAASGPVTAVGVHGNQLVNQRGAPLQLLGASRASADYACVQNRGIFQGDTSPATVLAMADWGMSAVRVPLNEDCWLGINGVDQRWSGPRYQQGIDDYVQRLTAHGLAVILDLQWSAPGATLATSQAQMPDFDHSPAFWRSVAGRYRNDPSVIFDLFNEPNSVSWSCWRDGCETSAGWQAAGMQTLVNAVRSTGARNVVLLAGLRYANDISQWRTYEPHDPVGQVAASFHVYNFNACVNVSCWDTTVAPVASSVPVVAAEVGEDDCRSEFTGGFLGWADAHGVSTLAWAWNTFDCRTGPALITTYAGSPTPYGAGVEAHFRARRNVLIRTGAVRVWHW